MNTSDNFESHPDGDGHRDGQREGSHNTSRNTERYSTDIGVDTIGFLATDFKVVENTELQVRTATNAGTGETSDGPLYRLGEEETVVEGIRAFANLDEISVTVHGPQSLYVQATLPRLLAETNRSPVATKARFLEAIEKAKKQLRQFGIKANLLEADITRLDICRNVHTVGRLPDYEKLLRRCFFPRTDERHYEDGGYYWTNDSRELLLYGKGAKEDTNPHVQRLEYRLTRKRSVEAQVGAVSVSDLLNEFGAVRQAYRSAVDKLLPNVDGGNDLPPTSLRAGLSTVLNEAQKTSNSPYSQTLQVLGIRYLLDQDALEEFLDALEDRAGRMTVSRYRDRVDDLTPLADLLSEKERTTTDMLDELRGKLLA
jgi:hypothetical protein